MTKVWPFWYSILHSWAHGSSRWAGAGQQRACAAYPWCPATPLPHQLSNQHLFYRCWRPPGPPQFMCAGQELHHKLLEEVGRRASLTLNRNPLATYSHTGMFLCGISSTADFKSFPNTENKEKLVPWPEMNCQELQEAAGFKQVCFRAQRTMFKISSFQDAIITENISARSYRLLRVSCSWQLHAVVCLQPFSSSSSSSSSCCMCGLLQQGEAGLSPYTARHRRKMVYHCLSLRKIRVQQ